MFASGICPEATYLDVRGYHWIVVWYPKKSSNIRQPALTIVHSGSSGTVQHAALLDSFSSTVLVLALISAAGDSLAGDDADKSLCLRMLRKRSGAPDTLWLEYAYCKHHPVLQYLQTKLAEWIDKNVQPDDAGGAWIS